MSTFFNNFRLALSEPAELRELREEYEEMLFTEIAESSRSHSTLTQIWEFVSAPSVRLAIIRNPACPAKILQTPPHDSVEAFFMQMALTLKGVE